jgi:hypothetical protein
MLYSLFCPEDGVSNFLRNVGDDLPGFALNRERLSIEKYSNGHRSVYELNCTWSRRNLRRARKK